MSAPNITNGPSSSGSGKGQWSKKREEVYMEQMNILNPPYAGHGNVTKTWDKLREIVNNVDSDRLKPLSKRSIEGKHHELLANYKKIDDTSADNEPRTKLDQYIIEYKRKFNTTKKKKTKKIEVLRKDSSDAQDTILERTIVSGSGSVDCSTENEKRKRKATDDGQPEGSKKKVVAENYLSGPSHVFSDSHMIQSLRDEMKHRLAEKEGEVNRNNRQAPNNAKGVEDKIAELAERVDLLGEKIDKTNGMIEQLLKKITSRPSFRRLAPAEKK